MTSIQLLKVLIPGNERVFTLLINLLRGRPAVSRLMNKRVTSRFLRGDKLSKLQGKTIMLIAACSHQSPDVNAVSPRCAPDAPPVTARGAHCARMLLIPVPPRCGRAIALA